MAKQYLWAAALIGLGVACSGEAFQAATTGGTGGSSGSGGSSGKSGSGGGSGTGTGGSSAGSGGASTAGSGGTGGSGPLCPVGAPLPDTTCPRPDHVCSYPAGCGMDEYVCSTAGWVYKGRVDTPVNTACPVDAPVTGSACDPCVDEPDCVYVSCPERVSHAYCDADTWNVTTTQCLTPTCAYGQEPANQFVKDCAHDVDCTTVPIEYDCYGTLLVVGINSQDAERLRQWSTCQPTLQTCPGPPGPTRDENGVTAPDASLIVARCFSGLCISTVSTD